VAERFRLAGHIVCRETNTELRMLFDRSKGVMYELNETASAIVELLEANPATAKELVISLAEEFDANDDEIRGDVERLLADFFDAGLLIKE